MIVSEQQEEYRYKVDLSLLFRLFGDRSTCRRCWRIPDPLSRAKEILVTQYFRHNTEMLKERQQWLHNREQQEQRAMFFMDDQDMMGTFEKNERGGESKTRSRSTETREDGARD